MSVFAFYQIISVTYLLPICQHFKQRCHGLRQWKQWKQKVEILWSTKLSLSPSGWFRSLGWGVSHTGSPSPLRSIPHVHQVDLQVLRVVLHDVDPPFSPSFPTPLSTYVCLQHSPDTILLFSALYMPKPSQPGLPYFVRDARYSEDATDIVIPFLVSEREVKNPSDTNEHDPP